MNFIRQIGSSIIGNSLSGAEAQLQQASDQLTLAFEVLIGLSAILAIEGFLIFVLLFKRRV